jgi:Ca2+-binding RTX toxin-like protein
MSKPQPGPTLNVTTADTTVTGTVNLETINALAASDTIIAGPGYEYLNAGSSSDTLVGAIGSATFTGLSGSTNSTLVALSDPNAALPGVEVKLISGETDAGTSFSGNFPYSFNVNNQYQFSGTAVGIENVTITNNGDNEAYGNGPGSTVIVNGNGENYLANASTIIATGSGMDYFTDNTGTNTLTGGSGQNYFYEALGHAASKFTKAAESNNTITNFHTASDTLEFQMTSTGGNAAPTSWTLIMVNGVQSLHAVLGDGLSTLTLVGVTDPSAIHMVGVNQATGAVVQLADVPLAASVTLLGVSDMHPGHIFA